jgi:hypothetical protein
MRAMPKAAGAAPAGDMMEMDGSERTARKREGGTRRLVRIALVGFRFAQSCGSAGRSLRLLLLAGVRW